MNVTRVAGVPSKNSVRQKTDGYTVFSPFKTRRGTRVASTAGTGTENMNASHVNAGVPSENNARPPSSMKVVELREELTGLGIAMKDVRKLRKAELVQLLTEQKLGKEIGCCRNVEQ